MFRKLIAFSYRHPVVIMVAVGLFIVLAAIQFPRIKIDTDPENMLKSNEHVRIFHHEVKKEFAVYDFIVLGVVDEKNPHGVFNVETLNTVYDISQKIKDIDGVIKREIIAPSTKDTIRQAGPGSIQFDWLMKGHITNEKEALTIRDEALDNPLFRDTMISADGKALCIYVPIERKDVSYRVSRDILAIIEGLNTDIQFHITGLPVAEDTFGVEMFKQMAISAPGAGLIIFLLMLFFFKSIRLILSPMILAVATVILSMGLLIRAGYPVHIMSSMIPIFLMPIAVLDSVHILSEFFDKYKVIQRKKETVFAVFDELFTPMLYTSLTSAVGFFSLSFSPIPPVQTFGVFVAIGVMIAWVLTITFIPAYIALLSEASLGAHAPEGSASGQVHHGFIDDVLIAIRKFSLHRAKLIVIASVLLIAISLYGISRIRVNDNPVRWFTKNHRIRVADRVLNEHFGGTYTAYLVMSADDPHLEVFKEPAMLEYIQGLQVYLEGEGIVGKSTSLADVVRKVYYELMGANPRYRKIPSTVPAVSQCLISFENSHKPDDLWHFTNPDYSRVNIWLQLKSGDNKDMDTVFKQVKKYLSENPPPAAIDYDWAGLTYINLVWQNKMVTGMLMNFLGSFIIVFFMMTFLFRSPLRGLVSMVPLTITIVFIYSLLGFLGKDYDMPVAVLSALTLGLSIDFAIHFIQRAREIYTEKPSWDAVAARMFQGPARAIARNALVIAIGFLPLLFAPLVPYKTVGFFMFAIMFTSSIATLIILPALITVIPGVVFDTPAKPLCNCAYSFILALAASGALVYVLRGYTSVGWGPTVYISIGIVAAWAALCSIISRRAFCVPCDKNKEVL